MVVVSSFAPAGGVAVEVDITTEATGTIVVSPWPPVTVTVTGDATEHTDAETVLGETIVSRENKTTIER